MTIKKRDLGNITLGAIIAESVHKISGKTIGELITGTLGNKGHDEIVEDLLKDAGNLTEEEKQTVIAAMKIKPVFDIITGRTDPNDLLDGELERKAKTRLKEIQNIDEETYRTLKYMLGLASYGKQRKNRFNKFIVDNSIEDIVKIHKLVRKNNPHDDKVLDHKYFKWVKALYKAFDFEPKDEDNYEYIAYEVRKILLKKTFERIHIHVLITDRLEEKFGEEIVKKYYEFDKSLKDGYCYRDEEKEFIDNLYQRFTESPEETLRLIKDAMEIESNIARKQVLKQI